MTNFVEGLLTQARVVHALILRETRTLYGRHQLGYLWAFVESLFWVLTFYALFYFMARSAPSGMHMFPFLATGVVPFLLFRHTLDRCIPGIEANKALMFYPQVRPLDVAIARALLEAATQITVFVVLLGGFVVYQGDWRVDSLLRVIVGLTLGWLLGFATGTLVMAAAVFFPSLERVVPLTLRPMFFISGVFFAVNELPAPVADALLYNPVLHVVELVRDGWFREHHVHRVDGLYVLAWIIPMLYLALLLERLARRRMQLT